MGGVRFIKIGIIDVDGHNFPNLPLMKISAYHKSIGDSVEWYEPLFSNHMDKVYMSKVFTFTPDYEWCIDADKIVKSGTGYFYPDGGEPLPDYIEHIYPDYSIYYDLIPETKSTAYGFLTRGCPRGCDFCIVKKKEGSCSKKVADLSEFWNGQRNIVLLDPNITACRDWEELFQQLIDSNAWVDFSQGLDVRMMTEEKAKMLKQMKIKQVHFAWDRYEDKKEIVPKFKMFAKSTGWDYRKMAVYILCNFDTTFEQDLERVYTLRDMGYNPYVMLYDKEYIPQGHRLRHLQRWVNNRIIFRTCKKFEDYLRN